MLLLISANALACALAPSVVSCINSTRFCSLMAFSSLYRCCIAALIAPCLLLISFTSSSDALLTNAHTLSAWSFIVSQVSITRILYHSQASTKECITYKPICLTISNWLLIKVPTEKPATAAANTPNPNNILLVASVTLAPIASHLRANHAAASPALPADIQAVAANVTKRAMVVLIANATALYIFRMDLTIDSSFVLSVSVNFLPASVTSL